MNTVIHVHICNKYLTVQILNLRKHWLLFVYLTNMLKTTQCHTTVSSSQRIKHELQRNMQYFLLFISIIDCHINMYCLLTCCVLLQIKRTLYANINHNTTIRRSIKWPVSVAVAVVAPVAVVVLASVRVHARRIVVVAARACPAAIVEIVHSDCWLRRRRLPIKFCQPTKSNCIKSQTSVHLIWYTKYMCRQHSGAARKDKMEFATKKSNSGGVTQLYLLGILPTHFLCVLGNK